MTRRGSAELSSDASSSGGQPGIAAATTLARRAHAGDLYALQECIRECEDVNATIDLPNQHRHTVVGVTPLYLAAQAGHREACTLLVRAGADVLRTCCVPESGDTFGPADIALVHFNLKAWLYLCGVRKQRLAKLASTRRMSRAAPAIAAPLMEQALL